MSSTLRPVSTSGLSGWQVQGAANCHQALDENMNYPDYPGLSDYIFMVQATSSGDVTIGFGNLPGAADRVDLYFYASLEDDNESIELYTTLSVGGASKQLISPTRGNAVLVEGWFFLPLILPRRSTPWDSDAVSARFQITNLVGALIECRILSAYVVEQYRGGSPYTTSEGAMLGVLNQ